MANLNVVGVDLTTGNFRPLTSGDTPTNSSGSSIGGMSTLKKTSNQTFSDSYADVTDLSFSVAANTDYAFNFYVTFQSDATTRGVAFSMNGPASPTAIDYFIHCQYSEPGKMRGSWGFYF